ncbi:MAG: alpha/beta hydrolase [Microbacteriaceae bacterium]
MTSVRDRIDPESRIPLDGLLQVIPGGFNSISDIVARREFRDQLLSATPVPKNPNVVISHHLAPGPDGELGVRVYSPRNVSSPAPGLIYIHGGGMIMGGLEGEDGTCQMLADSLGAVIASVDYRKAPENPYPAGPEDCFAAASWVFNNAEELGIDSDNVGIYGPSAGGGLAIAVALMARDRGGPSFSYMVPIHPMIDDRNVSESSHMVVDVGIWDRDGSLEAWSWYLGGSEADHYAAPARAENLSGLPPTFMDVGELDMFRDENIEFAKRLSEADVPVEFHLWPGSYHASEIFAAEASLSQRIWATRLAGIARLINR